MNITEDNLAPAPAPKTLVISEEAKSLAAEITRQLNEEFPVAVVQIERIVQYLGAEGARELLRDTLELEAGAGVLTADKERRRTPGGVYLHLARSRVPRVDHKLIWSNEASSLPELSFPWEDRLTLMPELLQEQGLAATVKITLKGRPGKIIEKGGVVLTSMKTTQAPTLPKNLPTPPAEPTVYVVYIARDQWQRVRETIQAPQAILIVVGFPVFDKRLNAMAVYATNTATKLLDQAKREIQRAG